MMLTCAPFPGTIPLTLANFVHLLSSAQCSPGGNTSGFFLMRCQNTLILKIVAFLVLADLGVELVILLRTGQAPARSELRLAVLAGLFGLARSASGPPPANGGGQDA